MPSCGSKCSHLVNFDLESLKNIVECIIVFYHMMINKVLFLLILKTLLTTEPLAKYC
jgi:hypothetical protein